MAFSPQIAPLERFALRDGSKSPMKGEVPCWFSWHDRRQSLDLHLPIMGEAGRGPSLSVSL
ncbi:MAG: hypothetical protein BGO83_06950 [Devosia sp. 66-14]|nr:MAG: hypothetical protein ABS47_13230 [Devosia sp. SCN 66-27]OJX24362.1 MAG: hypothetical protein BGO83_06950 [Devosia sp. 66-14]